MLIINYVLARKYITHFVAGGKLQSLLDIKNEYKKKIALQYIKLNEV